MRPKARSISAKSAMISSRRALSQVTARLRRPTASISRLVVAAPSVSISLTTTSAPAPASPTAMACPRPPLAPPPVTSATFPVRSNLLKLIGILLGLAPSHRLDLLAPS